MLKPNLSRKFLSKVPLSDLCKSIIYGTILGDGKLKLYKGYANARLSIKHSIVQKEYFDWLVNSLKEINNPKSVVICKPTGFNKNTKLLYQSKSLECLTDIYNMTYLNNKLVIKRSWLNHMNEISLMVWWLDDGSIICNGKKGVFCTDGFSREYIDILKQYLESSWDIKTTIGLKRGPLKNYYRLYLNSTELNKFLKIITPYKIPAMEYKFYQK